MKCSYCGKELEKGSEFCPECGMILGLNESGDGKKGETAEPEFKVPEYTPNVFTAIDVEETEDAPAEELEADGKEEVVSVTENIPEYVSEVPGHAEDETEEMQFEDISSVVPDENGIIAEEPELTAPEYVPAPDMPKEDDLKIRVPQGEVTYPEYEKYKNEQSESEVVNPTEEEYEEVGSDDIYVETGKKKNVLAVFLVIAVICVIVGGVYAVKNVIPVSLGNDETTTEVQQTSDVSTEETAEDTTEADTTEAEETEDTTEGEETTEDTGAVVTDEDVSDEEETSLAEDISDEDVSTTKAAATVTATTKAPFTTKHYSSNETSTTKRHQSSTTDPYGINDVKVKTPAKVYDKTFVIYCTAEGVKLRNEPSTSSERILFLSKGANLTVYGKENGFYYVRSNRYGVYGWVSEEYTAEKRPEEDTTKVYKNTVSPDKKYEKIVVKHTTNGLNLRKGPGKDHEVVSIIPKDYPVKVIGYKKNVSGWVYVTDTTYGISGWVSTEYLK